MKNIIFILLLLFTCSCSINRVFETRDVYIYPIVMGTSESSNEEDLVLAITQKIYKEQLNIAIKFDQILYAAVDYPFTCPMSFDYIQVIDVDNQCSKYSIIVFLQKPVACDNIIGCGELSTILYPPGHLWTTLSGDPLEDSITLIHELGHIFGATHVDDGYVMSPSMSNTQHITFGPDSLEEIYNTLEQLNPES